MKYNVAWMERQHKKIIMILSSKNEKKKKNY